MAKKNNPKAEKAKRNLEYARAHRKKQRPFGRGGRPGGGRPFGDRPEGTGPRPEGAPRPVDGAPRPEGAPAPRPAEAPAT